MLELEKIDVRKKQFSASIFSSVGRRFGMVFERFFESKTHATSKDAFLAKALKSLILLRENLYFQGFEASSVEGICHKRLQKSHVFWDIDLQWFLTRFGTALGRPKSLIFQFFLHFFDFFSYFFRCKI